MSEIDIVSLTVTSGGSFFIGAIIGGLARNLFKLLSFLLGLQIALFAYLEYLDIITIEWDYIGDIFELIFETISTLGVPDSMEFSEFITSSGTIGGFIIGILVGFKFA